MDTNPDNLELVAIHQEALARVSATQSSERGESRELALCQAIEDILAPAAADPRDWLSHPSHHVSPAATSLERVIQILAEVTVSILEATGRIHQADAAAADRMLTRAVVDETQADADGHLVILEDLRAAEQRQGRRLRRVIAVRISDATRSDLSKAA